MQDIFNFFNQGWVGSLIGLIGIVLGGLGIFSYKISKSIPKPAYQRNSFQLIGKEEDNLPDEVEVTFKGKPVNRLTKTKLIFWNAGTEVVEGSNIVGSDPVSILFPDGTNILSFKILKRTREVNNFCIKRIQDRNNVLRIDFDYLDPKDGAVVEILHDSENRYPQITGTIKGISKCFTDLGRFYEARPIKMKGARRIFIGDPKIIFYIAMTIGIGFTLFGILPEEIRQHFEALFTNENGKSLTATPEFFIIFGLFYTAMPASILWSRRKKYPKNLEIFDSTP